MGQYALRCLETDYAELVANAKILGVVDTDADGKAYEKNGGYWDYIGYKILEDGTILKDVNGVKYVHINCATNIDVDAVARDLAATYPQIAQGLVEFNRFFITDPVTGKWAWPVEPMRVFL